MSEKLYCYELEIGKNHKYSKIKEFDLIAENDKQWVIEGEEFYIRRKKPPRVRLFTAADNWLFRKGADLPFYEVTYYTKKKSEESKRKVINALKKEAAKMCVLNDLVTNVDFNF